MQPCFSPVLFTTKRTLPKLLHLPPRHEEKAQRSPEKERNPRGVQAEIAEVRRTCPSKSKMNCPRRMLPAIPETLRCPTPLLLPESLWRGEAAETASDLTSLRLPSSTCRLMNRPSPSSDNVRPCRRLGLMKRDEKEEEEEERKEKRPCVLSALVG